MCDSVVTMQYEMHEKGTYYRLTCCALISCECMLQHVASHNILKFKSSYEVESNEHNHIYVYNLNEVDLKIWL